MGPDGPTAADERPHPDDGSPGFGEAWRFVADGGTGRPGLDIEIGLRRSDAWFVARVQGPGDVVVAVSDPSLPRPRGPHLEVRAPGLWADHVIEEAGRRWSLGVEAFGVAVSRSADLDLLDPDLRGERVAVGWELEWETVGDPVWEATDSSARRSYSLVCAVHGEVLVGADRYEVDTAGQRSHQWGH